jgi:hypothetical protein
MPVSSIAVILFRLYALNLAVQGLVQTVSNCAHLGGYGSQWAFAFLPGVASLILGAALWFLAPPFSRFLAARHDERFHLDGVTETQLYSAVFLGVGLWFALTSFSGIFNWLHYFVVSRSDSNADNEAGQTNIYDFWHQLLTFAAGLVLVLTCRTWASKLTKASKS